MKAPDKLKIGGQEFIREDLLKRNQNFVDKVSTTLSPKEKRAGKGLAAILAPTLVGKKVEAKAQIPKELWAPIYKKIGDNKKLTKELKKLLKAGEPEPLMDFARKNDLDYDALRKIMSLVNPNLHSSETMVGILTKAVRALKDAGVVSPLSITKDSLWSAWTKAIDEDAKS